MLKRDNRLSQVQSGSPTFWRDKRGLAFDPPHLLIYFGVLLFAVILIILISSNLNSPQKNEDVKDVEAFRDTLEGDLNPSLISGNVVKSYDLPQGYDEFCFTDTRSVDAVNIVDNSKIQGSVVRGSLRNVFLFGKGKEVSFYVDSLALPGFPYYNCANVKEGKVEVELSSDGKEVTAKLPVNGEYCKHAQENELSDGRNLCSYLDNVYYQGYKGECCQEYGYCC